MDPVSKRSSENLRRRGPFEKSGESSKDPKRPVQSAGVSIKPDLETLRVSPAFLKIEQVQPSKGAAFSGPAVVPDEAAAGSAADSSSMIEESGEDGDSRLRNSLVSRGCGLSSILEKDNVTLYDIFRADQAAFLPDSVWKVYLIFDVLGIHVLDNGERVCFDHDVSENDINGLAQLEIDVVGFSKISNELLRKFLFNESKKPVEGKSPIKQIEFAKEPCVEQMNIFSSYPLNVETLFFHDVSNVEIIKSIPNYVITLGLINNVTLDILRALPQNIKGVIFNEVCSLSRIQALANSNVHLVTFSDGKDPGDQIKRQLSEMGIQWFDNTSEVSGD